MTDKKYKILIVDDETPLLLALTKKFEQLDYTVITGKNGEEGLALSLEHHPDIILADIKMPKMDGIEFATKLREDDWGKDARIIMLTNLDEYTNVQDAVKLNIKTYLVKADNTMADVVGLVESELGLKAGDQV